MKRTRTHSYILAISILIFAIVLIRSAWVTEDAYITFRTIDNFLGGYGLTWNVIERVQAYTHPLWMFSMTFCTLLTGEYFLTVIALSLFLTIAMSFLLAFKIARSFEAALFSITVLMLSKGFVDYAVSGLENPMTFALIALFWFAYFRYKKSNQLLMGLSLIAGLAATNRMDIILIFVPALAYLFWQQRSLKALLFVLVGFVPFIAWEMFSLFYYGFPFPNTAYAKLNTGIAQADLFTQGIKYYVNSFDLDAITLMVIAGGIIIPLSLKQWSKAPIIGGMVLYLIYILYIGGDFMSGRFFGAPLLCAVIAIASSDLSHLGKRWLVLFAVILIAGLTNPFCPLYSTDDYGSAELKYLAYVDQSSLIADERAHYYSGSGLLNYSFDKPLPIHRWVDQGLDVRGQGEIMVTKSAIGYFGFNAGPKVHVFDDLALSDALLARIPIPDPKRWRIGHFRRAMPTGYFQSVRRKKDFIIDSKLAAFYNKLLVLTQGELFSFDRLVEIFKFNTGQYNYLVKDFIDKPLLTLSKTVINDRFTDPLIPLHEAFLAFPKDGVIIVFDTASSAERVEIEVGADDNYMIILMFKGVELHDEELVGDPNQQNEIVRVTITIPDQIRENSFDAIKILPYKGDGRYNLGRIILSNGKLRQTTDLLQN